MRLHGYCLRCHRIRLVTVRQPLLAGRPVGVPVGTCAACEDEDERRGR